ESPADREDHQAKLKALEKAFGHVRDHANRDDADAASSALTDAYFTAFEPMEREIGAREPGAVPPLEARFNTLRGRIGAGLKGEALASELTDLHGRIATTVARLDAEPSGSFAPAFLASLGIMVREGVEVIL